MDNYDEYIYQLQQNLRLFLRLIDEKPEFLKKVLREMDANRTRIKLKQQPPKEIAPTKFTPQKNRTVTTNIQKPSKTPIEEAINFLNNNFRDIKSVEQWSEAMGYSKSYFWRKFEALFRQTPQSVFIDQRKEALIKFIKTHKDCTCTRAAKQIHLTDGNGLYQFVTRNFDCTPTELMEKIWNGEKI